MVQELWNSTSNAAWQEALENYPNVIARQSSERLPDHDLWLREQLPLILAARQPSYIAHDELVRLTEWKMARGVWRGRNLALVKGNEASVVAELSTQALQKVPHPTAPIVTLSQLSGVGPATASAVMAAACPAVYPFFDELVAAQIPELEKVAFTLGYYTRYAAMLRERAQSLGEKWTPVLVERALWSNSGGKAFIA